ncbi:GC-rich sequence DNA-binding factor 2 [Limanda limanda]|uniref:GC-rich sequence DNA-binding factor 2 n=1 Tax=Limanda limanda TaxID=27771 RepID=UPI0029C8D402|nr:GC-rich sequence DNA-binding factor 2 [Limanda limanda]
MFNKKPRRNFRQRKHSSSDGEDQREASGDGADPEVPPAGLSKLLKVAPGRGISCSSKPESTPPRRDSPDSSGGEEAEPLEVTGGKEERGDDAGKKKTNTVLSFSDDREAEEPAFRLKKSSDKAVLFQSRKKEALLAKTTQRKAPAGVSAPPSVSPRQDSDSQSSPHGLSPGDDSEDDDNDDDDSDSKKDDSDSDEGRARSPSASSASDSSRSPAGPVRIPNAAAILAAKRQRKAVRSKKEYISLGRDGHSSAGSTPDHYSRDDDEERVIDDDDDEPDDHQRRIEFAPRLKSIRERIAEKLGGSDGSMSWSDGEEQELWEETQIGKGVKRHPGQQSPSGSESSSSSISISRRDRRRQKMRISKTLPSISVSMIKRRITGKLDSLKEVHSARQAELRRMEGDVESATTSVEALSESSSERQLKFYRSMTLYVHNLLECLQEKVVEINSLELELHTVLSDQMDELCAQRRQKVKEQAERLQQLSYGTEEQDGSSANGSENQGGTSTEEDSDIPEDSQPSAEEEEQLQKEKADIMLRSQALFSDVQEDFFDVKKILSRFEEWRGSYSDSYHSAYISLCLPKLLNPIIRHQMLSWNPLKDASGDFENLPWFPAVETFCHGHGHEELEHTDRETLSNVIEKTVLPKMTAFVELVWDPMSRQQSACLTDVCHSLRDDYSIFEGEHSKPVKTFIEAVGRRLRSCVDEDVFIPLYPKKFSEDKLSPQSRFREQQFWTAIKLLGNMGKWALLLPETLLKELMLDKLLSRYLMIALCSHTQPSNTDLACKKIGDSLPISWFKGVSVCLPQLQNFENHLVQKVHTICKQQSPKDANTRSAVVEVLQLLSRIRCNDSILAIAEKYHYEDVIYSHQLLNQDTE